MRAFETSTFRVYHVYINHDRRLGEIYSLLRRKSRRSCAQGSPRHPGPGQGLAASCLQQRPEKDFSFGSGADIEAGNKDARTISESANSLGHAKLTRDPGLVSGSPVRLTSPILARSLCHLECSQWELPTGDQGLGCSKDCQRSFQTTS